MLPNVLSYVLSLLLLTGCLAAESLYKVLGGKLFRCHVDARRATECRR